MEKVTGRTDDMLIIRGVNVFPSQIESVLMNMKGIGTNYCINIYKKGYLDELEILCELADGSLLDKYAELEHLKAEIKANLRSVLSINAKIKLVEPLSLERSYGKAKRVNDMRKPEER